MFLFLSGCLGLCFTAQNSVSQSLSVSTDIAVSIQHLHLVSHSNKKLHIQYVYKPRAHTHTQRPLLIQKMLCRMLLKLWVFSLFVQLNQTEEAKRKKNRYVPDDFAIDSDFKRLVSYNTTAVHIPTDIYEGCKFKRT